MKTLCLVLLILTLSAGSASAESQGPPSWKDFEAEWMQVFKRDSVRITEKGNIKTYILDTGVNAVFTLNPAGQVTKVNVNYSTGTPTRYIKAVRQTVQSLLGTHPKAAELADAFTAAQPPAMYAHVDNICFERLNHAKLGWLFYATFSPTCPVEFAE